MKITKPKDWEIKDRVYVLKNEAAPVALVVASKHSRRKPLLWFDEESGMQRELRYATNQNSPIVDEQMGQSTLGHIVFRNGQLNVKKENQSLQLLLSLYHPKRDIVYSEFQPQVIADNQVDWIELEIEALNLAQSLEIDAAEAILRVEQGSKVSKMSSKEVKRDILVYARNYPQAFLELAQDDNVQLRNIGVKAVEAGIIKLADNNRTFKWASNGRKLFTVPFEEQPYSALAAWFKTDEGVEVFNAIEKKLN